MKLYIFSAIFFLISIVDQTVLAFDNRVAESSRRAAWFTYNSLVPCSIKHKLSPALNVYGVFSPLTSSSKNVVGSYAQTSGIYLLPSNVFAGVRQDAYVTKFKPYDQEEIMPTSQEAIILYDPDYN